MQRKLDRIRVCFPDIGARVIGLVVLAILPAASVSAVGFRLPNQDPEAIARGNAFVATADNPSAIYYNPAGIARLSGQQIRAGIYVISADTKYTSPSGVHAQTDTSFQTVPQLYYVDSFTNAPISVGLGVYAPYGLSLDWGNNTPFNTAGEKGKLLYLCFNPVIAWRVTSTLSIAVGPTINYSRINFHQAIPSAFGGGQSKFDGDNTGFGFNAGILWQPYSMWSFGINYRSATTIHYEGTASQTSTLPLPSSTPSSAYFDFPQYVVGGVSFRPTPKWNLEFDLDWTDWGALKEVTLENTPFGTQNFPFYYQSSFMYEFGVTRQLGRGYFASVGYIYSENSSPDANFNPLIPDANLQLGGVGLGYRGKRWDWMVAYQFAYNGGRNVQNDTANPSADGTYKTFNNAFNVAATFKF